jgi:Terminase-like family.
MTEQFKNRHERKANRIRKDQSLAGAVSICEKCGEAFNQVWVPERKCFTKFKTCGKCRLSHAGKVAKGTQNISKATITYEPHEKQKLIHASKARFKVLACGARFGKDRCSVMEFIQKFAEMLSEDRGPELVPRVHAWIIAPVYKMSRQVWMELKAYFPREWIIQKWESDQMIETAGGGLIEVRSADDPDMLVGVGLDMVWITEAARIPRLDEVWTNLETRLMSPGRGPGGKGGIAIINSTPKGSGFFKTMFRWGQKGDPLYDENWESWQFSSWANPYLTRKDKKYLDSIKKRYPERIYRQEIMAEFLDEGNSVFPGAEACATFNGSSEPEPGETYVIGYDPARSVDFSGVVIRNSKGECVRVLQWTGKPWTRQIDEIALLSRQYNYATVVMDRTGLGEALPEALAQRGVTVEPVFFTNAEKEKMVNHLAMLIEQKLICYPNFPPLVAELKDYQYKITKGGNIQYSASTSHKNDDLVTACMLAYKDYNIPELTLPFLGLLSSVQTNKPAYMVKTK